jgi:hypothetical protein
VTASCVTASGNWIRSTRVAEPDVLCTKVAGTCVKDASDPVDNALRRIQNVEVPTWFVMESRGGEDWLRPSHPLHDEKELGDQDEVTYAIAARLPACALWNLFDCRDEDGVPLMTVVEWLRFIQARSQVDQDWMDKVCQGMFFGWRMANDSYRGSVRQLESTTRSLDGARRSAYNDRQLLMEFRSQSQRLQDEMAGDAERLQDQLTEADGEVDQLRANIIALTRQAYDDREKYDLSVKTSDARIKELERKLGASCLEELVLKKSLSEAHAESERLSATAEDLYRKYQAATSGENLLKLVVVDHKRTINFFTNEVEKMKLSHKDEVDRLRLELSQAKGVSAMGPTTTVRVANESAVVVEDAVTRVLHQEPGSKVLRWLPRRHAVIKVVGQHMSTVWI